MTPQSDRYLKIYHSFDDQAKSVIDMAVLIFEPVVFYEFQYFCQANAGKITQKKIKEIFGQLRQKNIPVDSDYLVQFHVPFMLALFPEIVKKDKSKKYLEAIEKKFSASPVYFLGRQNLPLRSMRQLLTGYFLDNKTLLPSLVEDITRFYSNLTDVFVDMIDIPAYHNLLAGLKPEMVLNLVHYSLDMDISALKNTSSVKHFMRFLKEKPSLSEQAKLPLDFLLSAISLYKGELQPSLTIGVKNLSAVSAWCKSVALAYTGQYGESNDTFITGTEGFRKSARNPKFVPENFYSFFYLLMLMVHEERKHGDSLNKLIKILEKTKFPEEQLLLPLAYLVNNQKYEALKELKSFTVSRFDQLLPFDKLVYLITLFLAEEDFTPELKRTANELLETAIANNHLLVALELAWTMSSKDKSGAFKKTLDKLTSTLKFQPLLSRIEHKEEWEQSLNSLLTIGSGKTRPIEKAPDENRLVYFVDLDKKYVQPILQTYSAKGWSRGRNIALKRLKEHQIDCMTEQDNRIAAAIKHESSYYGGADYYIDYEKMLPELAGHPYLFYIANPDIPVELARAQPELVTEKTSKGYLLRTDITDTEHKTIIQKETNTRYKLVELTDEQLSVVRALNNGKLVVPEAGREKLEKAIAHLSSFMTIHSDLAATETNVKQIEADSRIRVQLLPIGNSLKAEWFVKPFSTVPPYGKPGKGGKTVYGTLEGEKCIALRNMDEEIKNAEKLSALLSDIAESDLSEGPVIFDEPHDCLALLETLRLQADAAVVEWPEGERFKIRRSITFNELNLSVKGKDYWFEMSGELKVDEETVLSLKQLLDLTSKSKGRFVELKDGEFIALTEELKKRLDELRMYSSIDKTGVKINKFAVPALTELSRHAGSFKTDKTWKAFQKKIEQNTDSQYKVPTGLQAELRSYQEEGFYWLARLADWDAGACLADDMGLGKTIQALALLLHRADKGPALIVCPASVVANWVNEVHRFAPSLNVNLLNGTNREQVFEKLAAFDILVITYGILQSEEERLGKMNWSTALLDEAHAIKNIQAKTSKAAMSIRAGFRLILTGTPIQNHLGELWNLFNFINPGLLGTWQQFNDKFVTPVVKYGSSAEKLHLKKLISPFILRRTKSAVLDELPPKTEITQLIELSAEEMAFYEALRRQAIQNITSTDGPAGQQHLKALAEITRLRLACCNPSLVNHTLEVSSSKLSAFLNIVDELKENNHRALVFSQFIGHLAIVRKALDEKGILYKYLDGSTPLNDRAAIVKDFQSGKGDIFLISLKAGGLGLNLTAADYVIHLDPWWNPAIEDQASDRAYRIGQSRPVTVYRLVAKDTIEEKIIELHSTKRDLADSLLEGSDQAAKFTTEDLLNLLKEI